jgi:hypothetical protein
LPLYDTCLTIRIPANTAGMVQVRIVAGEPAHWSLSPSGKLGLVGDPTHGAVPGPLLLEELSLTTQELGIAWGSTTQERRIRLDCGLTTDEPEVKLEILKDCRVSATLSSGTRQESPKGTTLHFTVHDQVQSPLEQLPSGPPIVGVLSLPIL